MCVRDQSPRSCCCGCSLTCGVATWTILAGIGALLNLLSGAQWMQMCTNIAMCVLGLWALFGKSVTSRMVYFYAWCAMVIGTLIFWIVIACMGADTLQELCLESGAPATDCANITPAWFIPIILLCLAIQGPFLYLGTHIAYAYVAEGKEEFDSDFKTAGEQ